MIDWPLDKYKDNIKKVQQNEQPVIINNIIEELDKKETHLYTKRKKDEVWKYGEEEDIIDYVLFRIRELTGKLV